LIPSLSTVQDKLFYNELASLTQVLSTALKFFSKVELASFSTIMFPWDGKWS